MNETKSCSSLSFRALLFAQFCGAFNDNLLKLLVSLIVVNTLVNEGGGAIYMSLAQGLFVLPFLLFSAYAGYLADRLSKSLIIRVVQVLRIGVMSLACFFLFQQNIGGLFLVVFLTGLLSTFFSPAKYGLLPELLGPQVLSRGNGYIEFWTFIAILLGTVSAGVLKKFSGADLFLPGLSIVGISLCGCLGSLFLSPTSAVRTTRPFPQNPFVETLGTLRDLKRNHNLFLTVLAIGYFWFLGAFYQTNVLLYASQHLQLDDLGTTFLFTALAVGIGTGSITAGIVSGGKVELGLVPLGAMGLTLFSSALFFTSQSMLLSLLVLLCLGMSAGFYIVPLNAFLQQQSPLDERGRYLAASNFVSYVGVLLAAALVWLLKDKFYLQSSELFFVVGLTSLAVTIGICKVLPEAFVRCINWIVTHTCYHVIVIGKENIPVQGGALLVCNHVSFADPSLLLATLPRPVRFLMLRSIYEAKFIRPLAKIMRAIPISATDNPRTILKSLSEAREAILQGELVCIFAEGAITRIGNLLPFSKGFERIMKGTNAPIIPLCLDRVWGSIFSFKNGKFFWKLPKDFPYPVTVLFGEPLPPSSKAYEVRQAIQELSAQAFQYRRDVYKILHLAFLKACKQHPFRMCMGDSSGKTLRYFQALAGVLFLAHKLKEFSQPSKEKSRSHDKQSMVGVFLPSSIAAALVNVALEFRGIVPVNLNFTASKDSVASAIHDCEIRDIITSRAFLEKVNKEAIATSNLIFVEDVMSSLLWKEKLKNVFLSLFCPRFLLRYFFIRGKSKRDDLATVIFSSGSTGKPKGVMLSHGNISSNIESLYDVFHLKKDDGVVGALPFFHSFGFTATLWLPIFAGIKVIYHSNPLEANIIGDLIQKNHLTILMSTPTFLINYTRKCAKEQFQSLRYVVVGAEKLKPRIADAFFEKFQILPLEGYGCTELSPVALLNVPNFRHGEFEQIGQKPGSAGHPIPGVAARIVHPESFQLLAPGEEGLLLVKGPNVMLGYLGNPEKTAEVIRDGWYITGDIAKMDEDGFVTITDRLSRFSKIGGEMVPHIKIEEEIHEALQAMENHVSEQVCVVVGIADEKRGEKLVVLSTKYFDIPEVIRKLREQGLPNLWIPKAEDFFVVNSLPVLGTGKFDLQAMKTLAEDLVKD